jgi:hypothetical protein
MAEKAKYIYIAAMDVDPDKEAAFNEVYDTEHIPTILKVPGVVSAIRYEVVEGEPKYMAVYEVETPELPESEIFRAATNEGRWPEEIRPFTRNRYHAVYKVIEPSS